MGIPGVRNKRGKCEIRWYEYDKLRTKVLQIPFTPAGQQKAAKIRLEVIKQFKKGKVEPLAAPTLLTLAQQYLESPLAPSTLRTVRSHLNKYWLHHLHNKPVDEITSLDIQRIVTNDMRHLSAKSKKTRVSTLHAILEMAVPDFIIRNPAKHPKLRFKPEKRLIDPFTIEERDQLLAHLTGMDLLFYQIRFYAGLRPGEVIALTWADLHGERLFVGKGITDGANRNTTKTNVERVVNLHPKLAAALHSTPKRFAKSPIITRPDGQGYRRYESFSKRLVRLQRDLGIRY
ncbi:MAG: site-specific integrase, partial [Pseudomonadota bacterium]|nr:site-specific integrase [Pseudomonadota bacterium]